MKKGTLGGKICVLRKNAGLTQRELANILGVSEPAVCKWETGSSMPDIVMLAPIARALHTDINDLLSFRMEVDEEKAKRLVAEADDIGKKEGAKKEIEAWQQILHEYPNSDFLKAECAKKLTKLNIQGCATTEDIKLIERLLLDLQESEQWNLRELSSLYLASYYIRCRRFEDAEEYINKIPASDSSGRYMKMSMLYGKKDYAGALRQSEEFMLENLLNLLICLSKMAVAKHMLGDSEGEYVCAKATLGLEKEFGIPFWRGFITMIGYDIGMRDYDSALACFEQYVDGLVKMEDNLRESPYFTEIYPDVKVLSNGEYVDLQDFRREVWDTMQKEGYLKEIRKDKRFAESYKKFRLFMERERK